MGIFRECVGVFTLVSLKIALFSPSKTILSSSTSLLGVETYVGENLKQYFGKHVKTLIKQSPESSNTGGLDPHFLELLLLFTLNSSQTSGIVLSGSTLRIKSFKIYRDNFQTSKNLSTLSQDQRTVSLKNKIFQGTYKQKLDVGQDYDLSNFLGNFPYLGLVSATQFEAKSQSTGCGNEFLISQVQGRQHEGTHANSNKSARLDWSFPSKSHRNSMNC